MGKKRKSKKKRKKKLSVPNEMHIEHQKGVTGVGPHKNKRKYKRKQKHRKKEQDNAE